MPQRRPSTTRVDTSEVQGDESFVVLRKLKVGEVENLHKRRDREKWSDFKFGKVVMATRILEWNWVDDGGDPLPQPSEDLKVMDQLTEDESNFLAKLQMEEMDEAATKNSVTNS